MIGLVLLVSTLAHVGDAAEVAPAPSAWEAFVEVARVLQHPRCMNCHPKGDAPLQTDRSRPHRMLITRDSARVGLPCSACHRSKTMPGLGMPPGVPHWQLPPAETPMVFEGKSARELCEQLRDPKQNGERSLEDLVHHVEHDALVKYGWAPGGGRAPVPMPYKKFTARVRQWTTAGAPCEPSGG